MPSEQPPNTEVTNFRMRYITALSIIPVAIIGAYIGGLLWTLLLLPLMIIGLLEFYHFFHIKPVSSNQAIGLGAGLGIFAAFHLNQPLVAVGVTLGGVLIAFVVALRANQWRDAALHSLLTLGGLLYVAFPMAFLVGLRNHSADGFLWMSVILGGTWGTDTFAYFAGRQWGRRLLAPRISPQKTVEGALGGLIGGIVFPFLFLLGADKLSLTTWVWILFIPVFAILGDLFESGLKRVLKIKDSRLEGVNILPGHGGVLDRIDALLWVVSFSYGLLWLVGLT